MPCCTYTLAEMPGFSENDAVYMEPDMCINLCVFPGFAMRIYFFALNSFNPLGVGQGQRGALKRAFVPNICQRTFLLCRDPLACLFVVWVPLALAWCIVGMLWAAQSAQGDDEGHPSDCVRARHASNSQKGESRGGEGLERKEGAPCFVCTILSIPLGGNNAKMAFREVEGLVIGIQPVQHFCTKGLSHRGGSLDMLSSQRSLPLACVGQWSHCNQHEVPF
jgi:hypothetical protein